MKLNRAEVRLAVADIKRSAEFYSRSLGFKTGLLWPEHSPEFAILECDQVRMQLELSKAPAPCTLWIDVEDLDPIHARLQRIARVEWGPEVYSYGRKEFSFTDPDSNHIIISEVSTAPPDCDVHA